MAIPSDNVTHPFPKISMYFITGLPVSHGFDALMVMVDRGNTKGVILASCNKSINKEQTGELLLENVYKWFGLPDEIISDRGPQFAAKAFKELLKLLGITSKLSTTYHPQMDGATEHVNQEIKAYLSIFCTSFPTEWSKKIHIMEFTHSNRQHADRKHSLFELMLGESPKSIPITFEKTKYPSIEQWIQNMIRDRGEALAAHELAMRRISDQ